jgi:3' terminal RNA ribose 2'-O-methyltransferase Hen1
MLLTITYRGPNATDLGYLLHKNPGRPQSVQLNYGVAHVFYPVAEDDVCTAALLLDVNPIDLARGRRGKGKGKDGYGGLFDYVNDRPYVTSSFVSTAIARVYGTALSGRCDAKPELAEMRLDLTAEITMLPCDGGAERIEALFAPLGYDVTTESFPLDEKFEAWGESRYHNVTLTGKHRLMDLLSHLYVLIPVLDRTKHYWVSEAEVEKLLRHGAGWLESHPMKEVIISLYLKRKRGYIDSALRGLLGEDEDVGDETADYMTAASHGSIPDPTTDKVITQKKEEAERKISLNRRRLDCVVSALKDSDAARVLDLGCGEGRLIELLITEKQFEYIAGMDVSFAALERATDRLHMDRMTDRKKSGIDLFQGSLNYRDKRLDGFDAFAVVEVVEHMDIGRLSVFEKIVFAHAAPKTVVLTTPNREYNANYKFAAENKLRHQDHRFEWTRAEFENWAGRVADENGYTVRFSGIGDVDTEFGAPTQMGVFSK